MREIEDKAEKDCLQGKVYANPYDIYSLEFNAYERSWTQAQKKLCVGLLKPLSPEFEKEYPLKISKNN